MATRAHVVCIFFVRVTKKTKSFIVSVFRFRGSVTNSRSKKGCLTTIHDDMATVTLFTTSYENKTTESPFS